jgi:toxin FitB
VILLDTNVISELVRTVPDDKVLAWFEYNAAIPMYVSTITEAELWLGVYSLPVGKRRSIIESCISEILKTDFAGHIVQFDSQSALVYGQLYGKRKALGKPISREDCQIAAIAQVHRLKLATRNVSDFEHCDITLINPWQR